MHICYLTPEYPHSRIGTSGGLGTSIKNLAEQLVQQGIKVTVVVTGQQSNATFKDQGIQFFILKHIKYRLLGFWMYRKYIERFLNRLIVAQGIDLLEAPDWTGISAFMKLKVPLVIRFNGSDAYFCKLDGRPQKLKNYWFEKLALQNADYLVSVSAFTAQETKQIFNLKTPITIIPNSINVTHFKPQVSQELPNRVLYFGTLIRKKGVLELAPIFNLVHAQMPAAQFIFAGKNVLDVFTKQSTQAIILEGMNAETSAQTQFLGALPYDSIKAEIAKATVVVLPSFAEALPMTWLEAMAMEKAIVTSDIGWAKEVMVDGETGYMVHPENHNLYAERILSLLQKMDLRRQLGQQARTHVMRHFSSQMVTQNNINFYESIIQ
jgi:glycosyltransferase involved in cell wall biosynthesis